MIGGDDLGIFQEFYQYDDELLLRVYRSNDENDYEDYVVLMDPFDHERILMFDDQLWGNVDIVLEEV